MNSTAELQFWLLARAAPAQHAAGRGLEFSRHGLPRPQQRPQVGDGDERDAGKRAGQVPSREAAGMDLPSAHGTPILDARAQT